MPMAKSVCKYSNKSIIFITGMMTNSPRSILGYVLLVVVLSVVNLSLLTEALEPGEVHPTSSGLLPKV